jgi:galactokinase
MYNRLIKIALIVLITLFAVYEFYLVNIFYGIMLIFLAGIIILSIFKNENIVMAFYYLRKNNMQKAEKFLKRIKHPEKLVKTQEAYYYFLNGLIETQLRGMGKAETFFKKALSTGLKMAHDRAISNLNLAGIYLAKRNKKVAQHYLTEAKKADKAKLIAEQIKEFEKHMKKI